MGEPTPFGTTLNKIADVLGPQGLLANSLSGFAFRQQQLDMAEQVMDAIEAGDSLIAEAGTGTGKTFAYLVPALLSGRKVLISTGTRNLQDQLFLRDLPKLREAMAHPARVALLKGRANYLCIHRLDNALLDGLQEYTTTSGKPFEQRRTDILAHLFNHQTHHRGQAHTILSLLTGREPPSLGLLPMQRGVGAPDLREVVASQASGA